MKSILLLLFGLSTLCFGQVPMITNQVSEILPLSITNKYGDVFTNLTLTKVTADGVLLAHKAGSTKVKFADLPEELREKYQPLAVEAANRQKEEGRATRAFLARTDQLQRSDLAEKAKLEAGWKRERAESLARAQFTGTTWIIKGRVIQRLASGGLLVSSVGGSTRRTHQVHDSIHDPNHTTTVVDDDGRPIVSGTCLLTDWTGELTVVDGDQVCVEGIFSGDYQYNTVLGAGATVRKYKSLQ